jgi:hypothetical protein
MFVSSDVQEMTVKLEEKKAESKRKGNKNDFSLSTTPRQDKKAHLLLPRFMAFKPHWNLQFSFV